MTDHENAEALTAGNSDLTIEQVLTALQNSAALPVEQRLQYAQQLLTHALKTRDPAASALAANLMDEDPAVDAHLEALLNHAIEDQPDAVYAFVRTHLVEKCDECWVGRLQTAATVALQVAISDADTETTANWLTLIGREPANYELGEVLHNGILAARERAHESPELARVLIVLAARRDTAILDMLLEDELFLNALPDNMGRVLRTYDGDPLVLLQNRGVELFMVGMARAARDCASTMFSPAAVASIWELFATGKPVGTLPPRYQAEAIVHTWLERGIKCLSADALETLSILILTSRRDELFLQLVHQENGAKIILPRLIYILERSHRTINDALNLIGRIVTAGDMTSQEAADTYVLMLDGLEWQKESLPLVQQLARTLQKQVDVTVRQDIFWRMLDMGSELKDELVTKIARKRLTESLQQQEDDAELVEDLRRLVVDLEWSEAARADLTEWWRAFVRQLPASRLGRLDKLLEGKRVLEEERSALQTVGAVRRMMGGRAISEFAEAVDAAYSVLGALSEAFEANSKRATNFDPQIARAELNAQANLLSPQERQVLANNLRELAQIIATMGDNRTRANLMRRGEELDRELMKGEELPHSAVDAMKWLAGYWGGTQADDGAEQS
ncbi:MAG: hypothetical protein JNJ78_17695 [Anaerolineae bacterium]|nr:hypothetical protein [Anaerolineae bacterium]